MLDKKENEQQKLKLLILYAEVEIKNIEIILRLHTDQLKQDEVDDYLDKINAMKIRIEHLQRQLEKLRDDDTE